MKLSYQVSTPEVYALPGITSYQGKTFEDSIKALKRAGYDGIELMVRDPGAFDLKEVAGLLEKHSYETSLVCTGEVYGQDKLGFSDPDDTRRDEAIKRVKGAIDLAHMLGSQINLGRARGGYLPDIPQEQSYKRAWDAVLQVTEYASKKDVRIALEPVNTLGLNFINSTAEGLEFVKKVASPYFRIMLDTMHMHIEDKDIEATVNNSIDFVTFVHLADSNRRYPGAGVFDFPSFIGYLKKAGYDGYLSVEVFSLPDQDTALRKSIEYIRPLL
jgi:sugar phosphate isomerase/epimerase